MWWKALPWRSKRHTMRRPYIETYSTAELLEHPNRKGIGMTMLISTACASFDSILLVRRGFVCSAMWHMASGFNVCCFALHSEISTSASCNLGTVDWMAYSMTTVLWTTCVTWGASIQIGARLGQGSWERSQLLGRKNFEASK